MVDRASRYGASGSVLTLRADLHQRLDDVAGRALLDDAPVRPGQLADVEQPEGVERADRRPEPGGALPQLVGGLHVVGHGGDQVGLVVPVGEQVAEPLGQHPGLARAGRGDDAGRPARVGDRRQLVRRQLRRRLGEAGRREPAGVDRVAVDDGGAAATVERPGGGARRRTRRACRRGGRRRPGRRPVAPSRTARTPCHQTGSPDCGRRRCWPRPGSAAARARR